MLEDVWLEAIYGSVGRMSNDKWLDKVTSPKARFVFDATALRAEIFRHSGVSVKHHQ